jgi:hypothetical protein
MIYVEDAERLGRPSASKTDENVMRMKELFHENWRLMIPELANGVGISFGSRQSILTI